MVDLLSLLFPKRCVSCGTFGSYICTSCLKKVQYVDEQVCPVCQLPAISGATHPRCQTRYSLDGLLSFVYFFGPPGDLIRKLKYRLVFDLAKELVELSLVRQNTTRLLRGMGERFILVPVPLHATRARKRGFNQAEVLGRKIAEAVEISFSSEFLKRTKDTPPQVDLKRKERLINVSGAFEVSKKDGVSGKNFLLFDDVTTTGATLRSCAHVLKRAGARSVWGLTLAR